MSGRLHPDARQSPDRESNPRPSPYHGDALPTELSGQRRRGYRTVRRACARPDRRRRGAGPCPIRDRRVTRASPAVALRGRQSAAMDTSTDASREHPARPTTAVTASPGAAPAGSATRPGRAGTGPVAGAARPWQWLVGLAAVAGVNTALSLDAIVAGADQGRDRLPDGRPAPGRRRRRGPHHAALRRGLLRRLGAPGLAAVASHRRPGALHARHGGVQRRSWPRWRSSSGRPSRAGSAPPAALRWRSAVVVAVAPGRPCTPGTRCPRP